jgi:hypothetical protein
MRDGVHVVKSETDDGELFDMMYKAVVASTQASAPSSGAPSPRPSSGFNTLVKKAPRRNRPTPVARSSGASGTSGTSETSGASGASTPATIMSPTAAAQQKAKARDVKANFEASKNWKAQIFWNGRLFPKTLDVPEFLMDFFNKGYKKDKLFREFRDLPRRIVVLLFFGSPWRAHHEKTEISDLRVREVLKWDVCRLGAWNEKDHRDGTNVMDLNPTEAQRTFRSKFYDFITTCEKEFDGVVKWLSHNQINIGGTKVSVGDLVEVMSKKFKSYGVVREFNRCVSSSFFFFFFFFFFWNLCRRFFTFLSPSFPEDNHSMKISLRPKALFWMKPEKNVSIRSITQKYARGDTSWFDKEFSAKMPHRVAVQVHMATKDKHFFFLNPWDPQPPKCFVFRSLEKFWFGSKVLTAQNVHISSVPGDGPRMITNIGVFFEFCDSSGTLRFIFFFFFLEFLRPFFFLINPNRFTFSQLAIPSCSLQHHQTSTRNQGK